MGSMGNAYNIVVIILKQSCEDLHITYLLNSESHTEVVKARMIVFTNMFHEN
jgi:hypothetical protein